MPRFLHTGDWQLGMPRGLLAVEAQARYAQARFDMVRGIGRMAGEEGCAFVVVAGDVFESNQLAPQTVARALEAMADIPVPVLLLPGNHDPLNDGSVYVSRIFREKKPANVVVLADAVPVSPAEGVEVVGAPWLSKSPVGNPVIQALDALGPAAGAVRVCVAHGPVDILPPFGESEAVIPVDRVEKALGEGKIHFMALGDRHSLTRVGSSGRIWYAGTPEQTSFDEVRPGYVNIVEIGPDGVDVAPREIGRWKFVSMSFPFSSRRDVEAFAAGLDAAPDKELTVVRAVLAGSLGVADREALEREIEHFGMLFAGLDIVDGGLVSDPGIAGICA